jgi:hypothetical protein
VVLPSLNVGSGPHYCPLPGWVNLDLHHQYAPDVKATVFAIPFRDGIFSKAYMGHFLEHLEWESIPDALAEVRRVLCSDAQVVAVGPCIERAIRTNQPDWLLREICQGIEGPGRVHKWTPTELLTRLALEQGGFVKVRPISLERTLRPRWPNTVPDPWQCALAARNP